MDTIFIYKCLWFWRAFFMCKMKTHSRLAGLFFRVLVPGSSTPRCESYSSSSLYALPPLPCVPKMYWFVFISDSVPGSPPGHRSPAGSKEQEERPRKPGVDEVAALPRLCCAADLDPLEPKTQTRPEEPARDWDQQDLGMVLLPLGPSSLCPLTPTFFYCALMEEIREKYLCFLFKLLSPPVGEIWSIVIPKATGKQCVNIQQFLVLFTLRCEEGCHI